MCGICGYVGPKRIKAEKLEAMNDTMYHRGPNDGGIWQYQISQKEIGLAQRRLSILDLSALGHQPMLSEDGSLAIVFNGEIYNFKELRRELEEKGYTFKSNCDTEVVLYAYAEWGDACFSRFNGMFAIAIYDLETDTLTLARDRMGKKPLYYYMGDGHFVFGSELKPIMEYPYFKKEVDKDVIGHFLCNKYLVAPLCIFKDAYKLIPGTVVKYQNGSVEQKVFWDAVDEYKRMSKTPIKDYEECKKEIDRILQDAIGLRLVADVPVGTFLSGGIDSTLVTAIAQKNSDISINSYSIGFYDKERNEAPFAAEIAKYLGTNHHEHYVTEEDIFSLIEDLPKYYDEPFSDSSQLPTMLVSQYASKDITVSLSGDGGDELFCGYKIYDLVWIAQHADFLGGMSYHFPGGKQFAEKLPPEIRAFINNRNLKMKTQLFVDVFSEEVVKLVGGAFKDAKYPHESRIQIPNWQERRMLLDMQTYLPDDILAKTDRASMKYSLEVRCPILDYRLVEASYAVPHQFKYNKFDKKYILKDITYNYVPKELLDRPKKGFGIPLRKWLRTVLRAEILRFADEAILKKQDIFVPEAVQELIRKQEKSDKIIYSSILWSFYVFQRWYQMYIEDLW